jgi:hypothetical protein
LLLYSSHLPLGVPNGLDIQLGTSYFLAPSTSNQLTTSMVVWMMRRLGIELVMAF